MKKILFTFLILILGVVGTAGAADWRKYDSSHFIIYYKDAPLDFVKSVSETAEELYQQIPRNLGFVRYSGWKYDDRAAIYIYDSQNDYKVDAANMEWSSGHANIARKEIRTYPSAAGFFDSTLPHELAHIIFREFIGNNPMPLWLDEGVAMYQEKAKRWGANKIVLNAMEDGKFLSLMDMTYERLSKEKDQEIINIFYAEAASIVYYMIVELGESRFENFCRKLSDGIPFVEALETNYGRFHSIEDLNARWVDYLKSLNK